MLLRGLRMAQGGATAEARRMITEKMAALGEAQVAATVATLKGSKKHRVAKKALGVCEASWSQQAQAIEVNAPAFIDLQRGIMSFHILHRESCKLGC